ncbi:MAG TPA: 1-acyl-sn-glycerol-3-phosphate acyltransferase [Anaerolineales bacterium]|nr:1-acyl-sn-glycerol-3-phosphate acyltransferase [Anaerolineales bacterium]
MNKHASKVSSLTESLTFEITKALALPQTQLNRKIIRLFAGNAARRFSELAITLDRVVEEDGLAAGARWLLPRFVRSHSACGVENIPPEGPLVIASNHPASIDSVVISAYVARPDYKVIIGEIPFFKNLPNVSRHAIFAPACHDIAGRMQVVREIIRHLRQGGAILIFARGGIEADPAFMPDPNAEFSMWSRSLEIFLRKVPQTRVLVTMVSGVIAKSAMRHPITWFRKARPDRQRLAFMYQMVRQILSGKETFGLNPHVTFGDLISRECVNDTDHMLQTIVASAHRVLKTHMSPTLSHVASDSLRQV